MTMGSPVWLQEIQDGYDEDAVTQKMLVQMQKAGSTQHHLVWDGGLLRYKRKIWVGSNSVMQHKILQSLHSGAIGGHSGIQATLQRIRQLFAWPRMKQTVQQFVEACTVCKQAKTERVRYPGLLDRKSTRLNSSHITRSRMPSSA